MSKKHNKEQKALQIAKRKALKQANIQRTNTVKLVKESKKKHHSTSHPEGACGNIGCTRCNPGRIKCEKTIAQVPVSGKEKYLRRVNH